MTTDHDLISEQFAERLLADLERRRRERGARELPCEREAAQRGSALRDATFRQHPLEQHRFASLEMLPPSARQDEKDSAKTQDGSS